MPTLYSPLNSTHIVPMLGNALPFEVVLGSAYLIIIASEGLAEKDIFLRLEIYIHQSCTPHISLLLHVLGKAICICVHIFEGV